MEILRRGSTGPLVELLQSTLNKLGFNAGPVDGEFGERTVDAVRAFQRQSRISS
ncbi:MAG: peptidoglycan-binding protein [Firmicutes bacterium]|nr:peptidoglycan-binding protein [Bacillota bacterium]